MTSRCAALMFAVVVSCIAAPAIAGRQEHDSSPLAAPFEAPKWYHGKDGPQFTVVKTSGDVELRTYQPAFWSTTNITEAKWDDAYSTGTKRLSDYASEGGNEKGMKLADTVPTFTLMYPAKQGKQVEARFTIEYFVPHDLQDAPPNPKVQDVNVIKVEATDVWVLTFGGFAAEADVIDKGFAFMEDLKKQGEKIEEGYIGVAIYDTPVQLINRHNEIWVFSKTTPSI